ncbi:MAG TPA: dipeptide epimerase [Gemmatimonadetes bacterium]|jgi:L-alanine-DL-glutamate epimerase-like enolase superfamily enzyme|nr:dipeptide epimerase [Gemmatimonadota bacterium]
MKLSHQTIELNPTHPFVIARGGYSHHRNVIVRLTDGDGLEGYGEAAPNRYYGESVSTVIAALGQFKPVLERADPFSLESIEAHLNRILRGNASAKSAVSSALHDLVGKRLGLPVFRLWGLDAATTPQSSFTIAIAENHELERRVAEASEYPILKIKLGTDRDTEIVRIIRNAAPEKRLRVDANAAWTAKHAVRMSDFLAEQGVEMLEQPVAANDIEGLRFVRKRSKLPVFADESCLVATDVAKLAGAVDGINIKLAKCGSLREALRMVHAARALDMQVMAGCMIESSLGISAIAQISPLLDYADFDGAALLSSDPFCGASIAGGVIRLSDEPGLGATPAPSVDLAAAFQSA